MRLQLGEADHAAPVGADEARQQVVQADVVRFHGVGRGGELNSVLRKRADMPWRRNLPRLFSIGRSPSFVAECSEFFAIGHKLGAFACRCAIDGKDFVARTGEQSTTSSTGLLRFQTAIFVVPMQAQHELHEWSRE